MAAIRLFTTSSLELCCTLINCFTRSCLLSFKYKTVSLVIRLGVYKNITKFQVLNRLLFYLGKLFEKNYGGGFRSPITIAVLAR